MEWWVVGVGCIIFLCASTDGASAGTNHLTGSVTYWEQLESETTAEGLLRGTRAK